MTEYKKTLMWFRSDLRVRDNPALAHAIKNSSKVEAVFAITLKQWQQLHSLGKNKIGFILNTLIALASELEELGVKLHIIETATFNSSIGKILSLAQQEKVDNINFNNEYEINEQNRDIDFIAKAHKLEMSTNCFDDQVVIHPELIKNKQGSPYTVFTPFKKVWRTMAAEHLALSKKPKSLGSTSNSSVIKHIEDSYSTFLNTDALGYWKFGEDYSLRLIQSYAKEKMDAYSEQRDFPASKGTSKISAYLSVGSISPRQCIYYALGGDFTKLNRSNKGATTWVDEIIWREFYRYIAYHYNHVCKGHNFNRKYDALKWNKPSSKLEQFKDARTGIPIVDAAICQLKETGWMHNRLRMIVAMLLSKNLLLDWRIGEEFFLEHLVDADFCSNNGGWQWAASTGTDAAPYFRIFNPVTQSERFDPKGDFIRKYLPELSSLSDKEIHAPFSYYSEKKLLDMGYCAPIVDLKKSRQDAIEAFKAIK